MINTAMDLIPEKTFQELDHFVSRLIREQAILIDKIKDEILLNLPQYQRMKDFRKPVQKLEAVFLKKVVHLPQNEQIILKQALVAKLALHLPDLVEKMNFPTSILLLYPDALERLTDFLKIISLEQYDSTGEFFCKDIRFVLGLSIPCGARVVDMNSGISPQSVILSLLRSRKIDGLFQYIRAGGMGRWFRGHIESRYVREFDEAGNDNHYLRVAELLERHNDVKGFVVTSWYFDPNVRKITPRLGYLRNHTKERGAFFLQHGAGPKDIANAIKKSETRRRLYLEGKYIPTCYSMIWPRNDLLAWAEKWRRSAHD